MAASKLFTLQESQIFTAGNPVDPCGRSIQVRARDAATAQRKAERKKPTTIGRTWVVVDSQTPASTPLTTRTSVRCTHEGSLVPDPVPGNPHRCYCCDCRSHVNVLDLP